MVAEARKTWRAGAREKSAKAFDEGKAQGTSVTHPEVGFVGPPNRRSIECRKEEVRVDVRQQIERSEAVGEDVDRLIVDVWSGSVGEAQSVSLPR
jgi:hypothetical protein